MCKEFGVLPYEGGLFSQPFGHIMRLEAVLDMMIKKEEGDERRMEAQRRAQDKARSAAPNTEVDLA